MSHSIRDSSHAHLCRVPSPTSHDHDHSHGHGCQRQLPIPATILRFLGDGPLAFLRALSITPVALEDSVIVDDPVKDPVTVNDSLTVDNPVIIDNPITIDDPVIVEEPITIDVPVPVTVDNPVTIANLGTTLVDSLLVGLFIIFALPIFAIILALAVALLAVDLALLVVLALELSLGIVLAVIIIVQRGPLTVLRSVLLCDDGFDDFRNAFHDAYRDAKPDAPLSVTGPPYLFKALVHVYALFRNALDASLRESLREALFHEAPFRSSLRLLRLSNPPLDAMTIQGRIWHAHLEPKEPKDLLNILQKNQLQDEEAIWLLNTLSALHCDGLVLLHVSKICLTILLHKAPKWNQKTSLNVMLIEAVVTLVAISCSSNETYQKKTLTNSHRHPWLLVNLRNPELISRMIENINHSSWKELISLLFLVLYSLLLRGSKALAVQYLSIIMGKCDFVLRASALAVIAPALDGDVFFAIGGSLLAPQTQSLTQKVNASMSDPPQIGLSLHDLFDRYDCLHDVSQFPHPESLATLLLLSKKLGPHVEQQLQGTNIELKNPWLQLVANVIARRDIPEVDFELFHGLRVHNMIAALSLSQYSEGKVIHSTAGEFLLMASFFPSREFVISSLALRYYLETVISCPNPPLPSHHLSGAVRALFSPVLPDSYLPKGWELLHMFVDGFENLSLEWRQAFAEAFFTVSHRPLLGENGQHGTPGTELNGILTWDYVWKEEQEPVFTDRVFSGLDWMAMAWSLHLSQQSGK